MDGFNILTEFRFDIGNALVNSQKLQGAVDQLSDSAKQAQVSFESFATSITGQFNLLNFSVFSILKTALNVTNSIQETTKGFAMELATNMNFLKGPLTSFNDKLAVSRDLIHEIVDKAHQMGVSPTGMVAATRAISAAMMPQGIAGTNLRNAQQLAGLGMRVGKPLGMSGDEIGKQIATVLTSSSGGAGSPLVSALLGGSKSFMEFKGSMDDFVALKAAEKVSTLTKGLKELKASIGDTGNEIVTFDDITNELKDMIYGLGSVLQPLGEVIFPIVMKMVKEFSDKFQKIAPIVAQQLGAIAKDLMGNPQETIANMMALSHIGSDFHSAKTVLTVISLIDLLAMALNKLGILKGGLVNLVLELTGKGINRAFGAGLDFLKGITFSGFFSGLSKTFSGLFTTLDWGFAILRITILDILFPLAFLVAVFQTFRKAIALIEVEHIKAAFNNLPSVINSTHKLELAMKKIISPLNDFVDVFSHLIADFVNGSDAAGTMAFYLDRFTTDMDNLGNVVVDIMALISGIFSGIFRVVQNFMLHRSDPMSNGVISAEESEIDRYIKAHSVGIDLGKSLSQTTNNFNGNITIKNDFKDNADPDRIAFTMKDQIFKAMQNKTKSRGSTLDAFHAKAGG